MSSKIGHKGIKHYSGDATANLAIGQAGFDEITSTGSVGEAKSSGLIPNKDIWVGLKVVPAATSNTSTDFCTVELQSWHGDDTTIAVYQPGEMIWGCFHYINVTANASNKFKFLAYRG